MKRSITVHLSELALYSLTRGGGTAGSDRVRAKLERAVRLYLRDKGLGHAGWRFPGFLGDRQRGEVELELVADEELLRALEEQADAQGVSVSQMTGHAALYYAAERDAGRITQRILDDLDPSDS